MEELNTGLHVDLTDYYVVRLLRVVEREGGSDGGYVNVAPITRHIGGSFVRIGFPLRISYSLACLSAKGIRLLKTKKAFPVEGRRGPRATLYSLTQRGINFMRQNAHL